MIDNGKLAAFITGLGRFNDYGSTVAQTKRALETSCTSHLEQANDDVVIFSDCLKAINKVMDLDFDVTSIIAINAQFDGKSDEQPKNPGRLRDGLKYPHTDKIMVKLWPGDDGIVTYEPPLQIDESDLQRMVDEWIDAKRTRMNAWKLFAKLACLQPFQDGNKRTALITANHALGTLKTQDYLLPPTGRHFNHFMSELLAYYFYSNTPARSEDVLNDFADFATLYGNLKKS
ncbi:MAG: Fic family protein [Defluviitaleaceae bacterium]|nr:Fic family protein [Defluviitaleaceae bacterium]